MSLVSHHSQLPLHSMSELTFFPFSDYTSINNTYGPTSNKSITPQINSDKFTNAYTNTSLSTNADKRLEEFDKIVSHKLNKIFHSNIDIGNKTWLLLKLVQSPCIELDRHWLINKLFAILHAPTNIKPISPRTLDQLPTQNLAMTSDFRQVDSAPRPATDAAQAMIVCAASAGPSEGAAVREKPSIQPKAPMFADVEIDTYVSPADVQTLTPAMKAERKEFLRRLNKAELINWLEKSKALPPLIPEEQRALISQTWAHAIFSHPLLEDYALMAFISGHIDRWILSEIFLYRECQRTGTMKVYSLFAKEGTKDQQALEVLKNGLKNQYTDLEIDKFLTLLREKCPQRTQFYEVQIQSDKSQLSVLEAILSLGHTLFTRKSRINQSTIHLLVLSPMLLNALYTAKFKEQTCLANPIIGRSVSAKNLKHTHRRDLLVPCRLFPNSTPNEADGFNAPPLHFYHHDGGYHLWLESTNPHREVWIEFANLFEKSNSWQYKMLLERDLVYYHGPDANIRAQQIIQSYSESQRFWINLTNYVGLESMKLILDHLLLHKERFQKNHGIVIEDVFNIHPQFPGIEVLAVAKDYVRKFLQANNGLIRKD